MKNLIVLLVLVSWLAPLAGRAESTAWEIETLSPQNEFVYDLRSGSALGTNGVVVKYGGAVLTADRVSVNQNSGETVADGNVRIQRDDQLWVGEHVTYNFKTRLMQTEEYRTGKSPVFARGYSLRGDSTGQTYTATNALVTTDDYSEPAITVRARSLKIVTGKYFEARHALLYLDGVPVFYLPYYRRNLGEYANNFNVTPGYRSRYGPFVLGTYTWYWQQELDGAVHVDYRLRRGVGAGPDLNYHLGRWGDGTVSYYYTHDEEPNLDNVSGQNIPNNRQRVYFSHLAEPWTNLTVRAQVRYQSDPDLNKDFFSSDYNQNPQPSTYIEVNKFWSNFSLDTYVQPRVNNFFENVERLPDIELTGYRQQLWNTPLYYESESSLQYLRRQFSVSNGLPTGLDYAAMRADTYHQILAPFTAFGWLNIIPHAGGRFTYYSNDSGPGGTNSSESRGVFDTGVRASFKLSQLWPSVTSRLLDVDGLRHIIEPSVGYEFIPHPTAQPPQLPQFDYLVPSLQMRPLNFPEMNSIDAITDENTVRFGMRNQLQTRRDGQLATLLDWQLFADLRMDRHNGESQFSYVYSDMVFAPRKWLTLESDIQIDNNGSIPLSFNTLTIAPNDRWSWSLSHAYQRNDPILGPGDNLIGSSIYYRINENWGLQLTHYFEASDGKLEEQYYSVYRDFRAWTSAFTFRLRNPPQGPQDLTFAFTFSLKSHPRYSLGSDVARPYSITGAY